MSRKLNGKVKVYIETPDEKDGFHNATCYLPDYEWKDINGYSKVEMNYFKELIESTAHLVSLGTILKKEGFDNASNF